MKRIGLTAQVNTHSIVTFNMTSYTVPQNVLKACYACHVVPVILPLTTSSEIIKSMLNTVDGILITGGSDVCTDLYGEKPLKYKQIKVMPSYYRPRDIFEIKMLHEAKQLHKQVLGLCRGIQIINVAFGGTLYQNLDTQLPNDKVDHFQHCPSQQPSHTVTVVKNSRLFQSVGSKLSVNSYHHQAVKDVGHGLRAVAKASDGVVEGLESKDGLFQAVQWHPEQLWQNYPDQLNVFRDFFKRC